MKINKKIIILLVVFVVIVLGLCWVLNYSSVSHKNPPDDWQSKTGLSGSVEKNPSNVGDICWKEIKGREATNEEKKMCEDAKGEWSCWHTEVDCTGFVPCEGGGDFCTCACPRECIKEQENIVYGFDKCCDGLTKVFSHTTCEECETYTCVNCGNGTCDDWETPQNCSNDCK